MSAPTAAKGRFPYPHRTCGDWIDGEREISRVVAPSTRWLRGREGKSRNDRIRALAGAGLTHQDIADAFNLTRPRVTQIINGWRAA